MDRRLGLDLDADVEVLDLLGRHRGAAALARRRGADDGAGYHRHAVAHMHARLFLVAHAHARVGQRLGVAVAAQQPQAESAVHANRRAAQVADIGQHAGGPGEHGREAQAQVAHLAARDFEDLEFEHDLGVGLVLRRDQALGGADGVGCVAHDDHVDALVDEEVLRLEHRAQQVHGLLRVGVAEVEGAHHQFLVFSQLLRCVGIDQHRVLVEDLLLELVVLDDQVQRILDAHVAHEDRNPQVGADLAVEDEVQAGRTRQRFHHELDRGVAKVEVDRVLQFGLERRQRQRALALKFAQFAIELARGRVARVLGQDRLDHQLGADGIARHQPGPGVGCQHLVPACRFNGRQAGRRARIGRVDGLHLRVGAGSGVEAAGGKFGSGCAEQPVDDLIAGAQVRHAALGVGRLFAHQGFELGEAFLVTPLVDGGLAVAQHRRATRARSEQQAEQRPGVRVHHGGTPIESVWRWFSGR